MGNAWGAILEHALLPLADSISGHPMVRRYHFLEKAQWWDRKRLYACRDELLKSAIATAYGEVPFYRRLYDQAGASIREIHSPRDLRALPIVTKDLLRCGYPNSTTRRTRQRTYEQRTSGSTGTNFAIMMDHETAGLIRASFLLSLQWAGWNLGVPHLQTGMNLRRGWMRSLKDLFFQCTYASAYDLSNERLDFYLDTIEKRSIAFLFGYPESIHHLALRAEERGWNRPMISVVTWGDMLKPVVRKRIAKVFQCPIHDTYGCAEGVQIAAQCDRLDSYHIHALDVVVEILDDEGELVEDGTTGNIVITRLHPGPMPLIRYKIGDMGRLAGEGQCSCGRSFNLLDSIQGRTADTILTPSGNRLIVHFFTGILEHFREIESYQVVQEKRGEIKLRVVPSGPFGDDASAKIAEALRVNGAEDMDIEVQVVARIPLNDTGKRRFVISNVK